MQQLINRIRSFDISPTSRLVTGMVGLGVTLLVLAGMAAVADVIGGPGASADPQASGAAEMVPRDTDSAPPLDEDSEAAEQASSSVPIADRRLWEDDGNRILLVRKGQKVELYDKPDGKVVAKAGHLTDFKSPRAMAVLNRDGEWIEVAAQEAKDNEPLYVKARFQDFSFLATEMMVTVDLSEGSLRVRDGEKQIAKFPVTIGAAGSETPPGRFGVTDVFTKGLNAAYGCCAIALNAHQPNLPPGWIGGDRVAIHGTTGPVGGAESTGCLRATNDDVSPLAKDVPLGTPVLVKD